MVKKGTIRPFQLREAIKNMPLKPMPLRQAGMIEILIAVVLHPKAPAYLDAWREMGLKSRHGQADETGKVSYTGYFQRP